MTAKYAVIFTSQRKPTSSEAYDATAQRMLELVQQQKGFIRADSVRNEVGLGITVSYWESLDDIKNWKSQIEHQEAQEKGRREWYDWFSTHICKIE